MIKVVIEKTRITIKGHAGYDIRGKDIVCAACSGIVITSVNAALRFDKEALAVKTEENKVTIDILKDDQNVLKITQNMICMLKELAEDYKKNIKIEEEDRP